MSKLYQVKVDVSKIESLKEFAFQGQKGLYLDLSLWVNDEEDQYGNAVSLSHYNKDTKGKTYVGQGKEFKKDEDGLGF